MEQVASKSPISKVEKQVFLGCIRLDPAALLERLRRPELSIRLGRMELSSGAFAASVESTASWLSEQGMQRGDSCLILDEAPEHALRCFFAAMLLGVKPAIHAGLAGSGGPVRLVGSLERISRLLGPGCKILLNPELGALLGGSALPVEGLELAVVPTRPQHEPLHRERYHRPSPTEIAYYQLSSGTTGSSKAIAIGWDAFTHCIYMASAFVGPHTDTAHWMPLNHDYGLMVSVMSLVYGELLAVDRPVDFLKDPTLWLRSLSETGASHTAVAPFALKMCASRFRDVELSGYDLSGLQMMTLGGEPARPSHSRAFFKALASTGLREDAWCVGYGLGEATCVTHANEPGKGRVAVIQRGLFVPGSEVEVVHTGGLSDELPLSEGQLEVASVGHRGVGMRCWLLDEEGRSIESDAVCGEVVVDGPMMASHYLTERGVEPIGKGGWRTGDVGFLLDGHLYLVDRISNLIIRRGCNYVARELEGPIARALGVSESSVFVVDTELLDPDAPIAVVLERSSRLDVEAAPGVLSSLALPVPLHQLVIVEGREDTRTSSGKKRYAWLRHCLAQGSLKEYARFACAPMPGARAPGPTLDALESELLALGLSGPFGDGARLLEELGLDSVATIELAARLEDALCVKLDVEELFSTRTLGDLKALLEGAKPADGKGLHDELFDRLLCEVPQVMLEVSEQRQREIRVEDRWYVDFASLNYLSLDLDEEVISSIEPAVRKWGVHPSWSRAVASPGIYRELEQALALTLGAEDVLCFPTITLLHAGVLPELCRGGALFVDNAAHRSIHAAAELAGARGASVGRFPHADLEALERLLASAHHQSRRVIAVDGIYSMTGAPADLPALVDLAKTYDAWLYVDDAHGFGILGENPCEKHPWGHGGGGVVRWFGLDYERIHYVSGLSKAYSSMGAFVTCQTPHLRKQMSNGHVFIGSGPIPVASLASALCGLEVNRREGDERRARILSLTRRLKQGVLELGLDLHHSPADFPIVSVLVGDLNATLRGCQILWEHGCLITPAVYPVVPIEENGVRFSITSANTLEQIERALGALSEVAKLR